MDSAISKPRLIALHAMSAFLLLSGWLIADRTSNATDSFILLLFGLWCAGSLTSAFAWRLSRSGRVLSLSLFTLSVLSAVVAGMILWRSHELIR